VTTYSPNVEGMTAIAAWMIVCILFVFAALAGYVNIKADSICYLQMFPCIGLGYKVHPAQTEFSFSGTHGFCGNARKAV